MEKIQTRPPEWDEQDYNQRMQDEYARIAELQRQKKHIEDLLQSHLSEQSAHT